MLPETFKAAMLDPPRVHPEAHDGVWKTEESCYDFFGAHVDGSSVTFETGLGLSTVAFAMLGTQHTAVYLDAAEGERLSAWAAQHQVDLSRIDLRPGGSDRVLPELDTGLLDLVFIDGCHGYPLPQLDFMYAASRLRRGGFLVVDDTQLWAPRQLRAYLDADSRWQPLQRTEKWAAYRRRSEGSLVEEWDEQPVGLVPEPLAHRARDWMCRFPGRARYQARRIVRAGRDLVGAK